MDQGVDPNAQKGEAAARGTTLREAREWCCAAMRAKRAAPRSVETVREETDWHLSDWLDRPLSSIRPTECASRHARVTENSGPYALNRALQLFILLTGLRSTNAKTVRWEHVDFEKGTIHRPKPKGGDWRAALALGCAPVGAGGKDSPSPDQEHLW